MTVGEELDGLISEGTETVFLEFGLHDSPNKLKNKLQKEIDQRGDVDAILLGYGLCSMSTLGLRFEKIVGSREILRKMVAGDWDKDFVVVEPGDKVSLSPFEITERE